MSVYVGEDENKALKLDQIVYSENVKTDRDLNDNEYQEPSTFNLLYKVSLQGWYLFILIMVLVLLCIMIGSISTPRWVYQGKNESKWRSGILKCGGCQGKWENSYLIDIWQDAKDENIKGWENTAEKLYNAGVVYVVFECCTIVMGCIWAGIIVCLLKEKKLGRESILNWVVGLTFIFHSVAIAGWFGTTEAGFNSDCEKVPNYTNQDLDLCASHGAILAIFIEAFLFVIGLLFLIIFFNRKNAVNPASFKNKSIN